MKLRDGLLMVAAFLLGASLLIFGMVEKAHAPCERMITIGGMEVGCAQP